MSADLTIVPTPIGNLGDITFRAVEVLKEASVILAEDTRTSSKLLKHYGISTPTQSYHQHNEHKLTPVLVERMQGRERMALISDAGTPGISDPGFLIVRECIRQGLKVECLPGASALLPAIVLSGLPTERFVFEGFLPHKKGRQTRIKEIAAESRTVVIFESPHRIVKTLEQLIEHCGPQREASVSREISKIHEETVRGNLESLHAYYTQNQPKGEFVLVVSGHK